jgi:hypothetical protein
MEHMSTFVRKMENDLSHGDNMFSMVFTKESITKTLNNLKKQLHHAIVSSVFGIGQIIAYLVHYHMVVFCYVNAVVG